MNEKEAGILEDSIRRLKNAQYTAKDLKASIGGNIANDLRLGQISKLTDSWPSIGLGGSIVPNTAYRTGTTLIALRALKRAHRVDKRTRSLVILYVQNVLGQSFWIEANRDIHPIGQTVRARVKNYRHTPLSGFMKCRLGTG